LYLGIGDWGLGIGDWGLGVGANPQSPIPNNILLKFTYIKIIQIIYTLKCIINYNK